MEQVYLDEALTLSRNIMLNGGRSYIFDDFGKTFISTTECISGYLDNISYDKNRALSVLASGDHVFNLIHDGVREIDAFDINKLQYYVYHLKRALIQFFSYKEYLAAIPFFKSSYDFKNKMLLMERLKELLPLDVYSYYMQLLEYAICEYDADFGNLFYPAHDVKICNNYLISKNDYRRLQNNLDSSQVNLYFGNALDIPNIVPGNYDIVLLSNISDYLSQYTIADKEAFKSFIDSFLNVTNPGGVVVNYFFNHGSGEVINDIEIPISQFPENSVFPIKISRYDYHGYYLARKL